MTRAISLWQPWASLIAIGAKQYETRSWPTTFRGPLVIHAAKFKGEVDWFYMDPFRQCLTAAGFITPAMLPMGAALCSVDLVDCLPTESVVLTLSKQEQAFGNYQPGRWAWKLANVRVFEKPIPARGFQGLWDWKE